MSTPLSENAGETAADDVVMMEASAVDEGPRPEDALNHAATPPSSSEMREYIQRKTSRLSYRAALPDLPENVRRIIWKHAFHEPRPYSPLDTELTDSVLVVDTVSWPTWSSNPVRFKLPALLHLNNRLLRSEIAEVYYGKLFEMRLDPRRSDLPTEVRRWAELYVGDKNATHLRGLRVHIWRKDLEFLEHHKYIIIVRFDETNGLRAGGAMDTVDFGAYRCDHQPVIIKDLRAYTEHCDTLRRERGLKGKSIIHFFTEFPEELRDACLGPPEKLCEVVGGPDDGDVYRISCSRNDPEVMWRDF